MNSISIRERVVGLDFSRIICAENKGIEREGDRCVISYSKAESWSRVIARDDRVREEGCRGFKYPKPFVFQRRVARLANDTPTEKTIWSPKKLVQDLRRRFYTIASFFDRRDEERKVSGEFQCMGERERERERGQRSNGKREGKEKMDNDE